MKQNKGDLRLVIAGLGLIGKRHAQAIAATEGVTLAAIIDPAKQAQAFTRQFDIAYFADLADMFQAMQPDGVILATPTPLHHAQALLVITQSCPVLIEKPLAVNVAQAQELADASQASGVPVLVGYHRRHNPLIAKAHALITDGVIGAIRAIHATCWFYKPDHYFDEAPWRKKAGAGPISVNLIHDIDLIRYLCGDIIALQAQTTASDRGYENEDTAAILLRFANSALGTVTLSDAIASPWSWEFGAGENPAYPNTKQGSYLIGGSTGSLSVPDLTLWRHSHAPDWWTPMDPYPQSVEASDPLINQIAHFAAVIRGQDVPRNTAAESVKNIVVMEAISASAQNNMIVTL
ncbi:MAG: Gfo/Idh/MocA family oxidoreductase [Pseudomonadota bacterium]